MAKSQINIAHIKKVEGGQLNPEGEYFINLYFGFSEPSLILYYPDQAKFNNALKVLNSAVNENVIDVELPEVK